MKKTTLLTLILALTSLFLQAQTGFKWQGLAKDAAGNAITQPVTLTFSILQNNTTVYVETQNPITPVAGQLTATVGVGTATQGSFAGIDWSVGTCSLNVKMQVGNGTPVVTGTSEILPVPIASYAEKAGSSGDWSKNGNNIYRSIGNIGIGTDAPLAPLHIKTSDPDIILDFNGNPQANLAEIRFNNNGEARAQFLYNRITNNVQLAYDIEESGVGDFQILRNGAPRMTIENDGNVGIGTTNPASKLHVFQSSNIEYSALFENNGGAGKGVLIKCGSDGNSNSKPLMVQNHQGTKEYLSVSANGNTKVNILEITGGSDITEKVNSPEVLQPGDVIVTDPTQPNSVRRSSKAYDHTVLGVVSGAGGISHGMELKQEGLLDGNTSFAIAGRVYVKTTGKVAPGDLLTTSNVPGHAMKATNRRKRDGAVIGKALTAPNGEGLVLVLVQTR